MLNMILPLYCIKKAIYVISVYEQICTVLKDCWQFQYIITTDQENVTFNLPSDKHATTNALIIKRPNKAATFIVLGVS